MQANQYQLLAKYFLEDGTTPETLFTGLAAEVGEVMSERVKETRNGEQRTVEVIDELSDVLWYVTMIAYTRGYSLEGVMNFGIHKLEERERYGK